MKPSYVFITGATSGVGEALTYFLSRKNIPLLITGQNEEKLQFLSNSLSQVKSFPCNLLNPKERKSLIQLIYQEKPDVIINCAGIGSYGPAVLHKTSLQKEILILNSEVPLEITLESAKMLQQAQKKGVIINISSVLAFFVFPWMSVYAASKGFITQFSKAMDYELKEENIRVLCSCPGQIRTPFGARAGRKKQPGSKGAMTPEYVAQRIYKQILSEKPCDIYNWRFRLYLLLSKVLPSSLIFYFSKKSLQKLTP